jgi:hypothetical protein
LIRKTELHKEPLTPVEWVHPSIGGDSDEALDL